MATIEIEHELRVITFGPEMAAELQALGEQGWQAVPGVPPIVIYHLMRQKTAGVAVSQGASRGFGKVAIDETKVHILRNGQILPADTPV